MFHVSLGRVRDRVQFKEADELLVLVVDGDAARMVRALTEAQKTLNSIKGGSTDEERLQAARQFAEAIFGKEQAEKLIQFYRNDAICVIEACGQYFGGGLAKKITVAQKK